MSNFHAEAFCPNCSRIHQLEWRDMSRDGYLVVCTVNGEAQFTEELWREMTIEFREKMIPGFLEDKEKRDKFVTTFDIHLFCDEIHTIQENEREQWISSYRPIHEKIEPERLWRFIPTYVLNKHAAWEELLGKLQGWVYENEQS